MSSRPRRRPGRPTVCRGAAVGGAVLTFAVVAAGVAGAVSPEPIRIGLLVEAGDGRSALAVGAAAAAAECNATGGVAGRRVEVMELAPARPWRGGASRIARLVYDAQVVAVVGPTGGASAHLAAQIATRRRLPVITLAAEASLTRALDPWVFRGVPDDAEQARALLRASLPQPAGSRTAVAVPPGREGRERLAALRESLLALGASDPEIHWYEDGKQPPDWSDLDALLLWLDPGPAAAFLRGTARCRLPHRLLGSLRLADPSFRSSLPDNLEVAIPRLGNGDALEERLGYDMVRVLLETAAREGTSAAAIRDGLAGGPPLHGRTGTFTFDATGNREGPVFMTLIRGSGAATATRESSSRRAKRRK